VVRRDFPAYCTPQILDSGTFGENPGFQGCSKQVPWVNHQHMKIAYCTPVETGRKHTENMFRKQLKIKKQQKITKLKNKTMPHKKKTNLKLPTPRKLRA
jgi:hypothetical protein